MKRRNELSISADDDEAGLEVIDNEEEEVDDEDKYHGSAAPTKMEAFRVGWVSQ
jgi:hypothetical protein